MTCALSGLGSRHHMAFAAQLLLDFAVVEPRVTAGHADDPVLTDAQCQRLGDLSG